MNFYLFVQPNIFVHHWWSHCWNFGIYWLHWLYILLSCYGNYFSRTHGQGKVFCAFILWFLEPHHTWWLPGWAYGMQFYYLLILVHFISIWNFSPISVVLFSFIAYMICLLILLSSLTYLPLIFWKVNVMLSKNEGTKTYFKPTAKNAGKMPPLSGVPLIFFFMPEKRKRKKAQQRCFFIRLFPFIWL